MKKVKVDLSDVNKVKDFVKKTGKLDCDVDLTSDRYTVDGKSIMGIFSLNLTEPVECLIYSEGPMLDQAIESIQDYVVED